MIQRVFHVNVNVTNLDASISFYKRLGFRLGKSGDLNSPGLARAFGTGSGRVRWAHVHLGDGAEMTKIDLVEWRDGPKVAPPRKPLDEPGLARFSLLVDDIDEEYERLRKDGIQFLAPPDKAETQYGDFRLCVAVDPDGTNVQLIQPPKGV